MGCRSISWFGGRCLPRRFRHLNGVIFAFPGISLVDTSYRNNFGIPGMRMEISIVQAHLVELDGVESNRFLLAALELEGSGAHLADCIDHVLLCSSPLPSLLVEILRSNIDIIALIWGVHVLRSTILPRKRLDLMHRMRRRDGS